jgi:hypothetical protein
MLVYKKLGNVHPGSLAVVATLGTASPPLRHLGLPADTYMSPAKNLGVGAGRRGLRKILGGRVKKFHEILQRICGNLKGWSKNFQKMTFFGQIFPFLAQKFLRGGYRLRIFQLGGIGKASNPTPSHAPTPRIMYALAPRRSLLADKTDFAATSHK